MSEVNGGLVANFNVFKVTNLKVDRTRRRALLGDEKHLDPLPFLMQDFPTVNKAQRRQLSNRTRAVELVSCHRVIAQRELEKEWNAGELSEKSGGLSARAFTEVKRIQRASAEAM